MRRLLLLLAALTVLAGATAGSCGDPAGDKFERDCKAKGGHVATTKRDHSTSRVCLPPAGGWQ